MRSDLPAARDPRRRTRHVPTLRRRTVALLAAFVLAFPLSVAHAHESRTVGPDDGPRFVVVFGMLNEPAFTGLRSGVDLIVRTEDGEPVEGLAGALAAEVTAPTGETRPLDLRAAHGRPGAYVDDLVWTVPGVYSVRIHGFVGALEIDEIFETHTVRDLDEIRFP